MILLLSYVCVHKYAISSLLGATKEWNLMLHKQNSQQKLEDGSLELIMIQFD